MACASQNWPQDKSYRGSTTAGSLLLLLILLHPSLPVLRLLWSSRTTTSSSSSESWRTSTCSWTGSTTRSWSWRTRYRNQPCFPSISPSAEGVEGPIPGVRHSLFSLGTILRYLFWGEAAVLPRQKPWPTTPLRSCLSTIQAAAFSDC